MDVGGATLWSNEKVFSCADILETLKGHYGPVTPLPTDSHSPSRQFQLPDGTRFGIIASMTEPFCGTCDRSRLTADGRWYLCLYSDTGCDLMTPLRLGLGKTELKELISSRWKNRQDQGALERLTLKNREPLYIAEDLKKDPHLEMHTRGG